MGFAFFNLIFFLFLLPLVTIAQSNGSVAVGATLTATDSSSPWLSLSGDFAFGFQKLDSEDLFLLGIWYDKIPEKTIVWYANGDDPVPRGSKLELTAENGLVLSNPQGKQVWKSDIVAGGAVSYGVMNDTGNFALQSSVSGILWQSFDNPTDILLPMQMLEVGGMLFSRITEKNFSLGRFQLRLLEDGNLVINTANLPTKLAYDAYYVSGTHDPSNVSNSGYRLIFNNSGYMHILRRNGQRFDLTKTQVVSSDDYYFRATLNFDGIFIQYYYPKTNTGSQNWSTVFSLPDNICTGPVGGIIGGIGSGPCGFNSICSLNEEQRPTCSCPKGYSLLDPNDPYGSCKPDFELGCQEDGKSSKEDVYYFEALLDTDWPLSDYEHFQPYNEEDCKTACLLDCFCAVAIFGANGCWKKKLPLSNGRTDSGVDRKAFIKVRKNNGSSLAPNFPSTPKANNNNNWIITGSALLGSSVFVNFALIGAFCLSCSNIYRKKLLKIPHELQKNMCVFTYKELAVATNDFKEELGRGAFGIVYKGSIQIGDSTSFIAVKKLDGGAQDGDNEFKTEVNVIGQTHHKNLVRLQGICSEGEKRLLVYEYLSNGTLADFLFADKKPSWNQRIQIAFGIARGLVYLHEECSTQIIHCDIKPQNILLDDHYNARISDFGLAKILMMDQQQTLTMIRGTKGYVAPEWFRNLPITVKVDVYSFGVLLLEIICCRKSVEVEMGEANAILTDWAYDCYREGVIGDLVKDDIEAMNDKERLERFLLVAFWCIQEDPSFRPTMRKVIQMLEGVVEVPIPSLFSTTTTI